ncbi:MAG: hypothetical protein KC593_07285 [Myxococcales bacterium]|nr:hypothetical protein [Myxococcales bacterium]
MQLQRDTSLARSALSGAYVALAVLSALSAVGCQDPDPPCNVYDVRGYWGRIPAELGFSREEILTLDTLGALDEALDIRGAFLHARCRVTYDFIIQGSQGAYEDDLPRSSDIATTCAALAALIGRFRADHPNALDGVHATGAPECAVDYQRYLQDVAYCTGSEDLDASALSCSSTTRLCADPQDEGETCLECEGELSYAGLSEACTVVLAARAALTARCPDRVVAGPTEPTEGQELATRSIMGVFEELPAMLDKDALLIDHVESVQRDLDRTLRRSRVRACQEPANATLEEALAQLRVNAASMRGVLDALGESE